MQVIQAYNLLTFLLIKMLIKLPLNICALQILLLLLRHEKKFEGYDLII